MNIVSFSDWIKKQEEYTPETLPSGLTVGLREVDLQDLALNGAIPLGVLQELIDKQDAEQGKAPVDMEDLPKYSGMLDAVFKSAVVAVATAVDDNGNPVLERITDEQWAIIADTNRPKLMADKLHVMSLVQEDTDKVATFPESDANGDGAVSTG